MADQPRISILGCGWLGLPLAKVFVQNKYEVKGSTTRREKFKVIEDVGATPFLVDLGPPLKAPDEFFNTDILMINFPPRLRGGEGLEKFAAQLGELISAVKKNPPSQQIIFVSSTSIYGLLQGEVDESTEPLPSNDAGRAILAAESALKEEFGERLTIVRPGGLVGPGRFPGKFLAGEINVRDGDAPVNLVHLDDCVGVLKKIVADGFTGVVNLVAPETKMRREFYPLAARKLGVEEPLFLKQGLEPKQSYKRVSSKVVSAQLGYEFIHPRIWELDPED